MAETLANQTGNKIKVINVDPSSPFMVGSGEFDECRVMDTKNLDWTRIKALIWW